MRRENQLIIRTAPRLHSQEHSSGGCLEHGHPTLLQLSRRPILRADIKPVYGGIHHKKRLDNSMERLYMETQVGLKTTALTLFLNLFFHFLPAAALCDDFSLVDSVET